MVHFKWILFPKRLKDVLENSRDHDSSTKVPEILQVYSEAKEAMLMPERCLRSQGRVLCRPPTDITARCRVFWPSLIPRYLSKAARSATLGPSQKSTCLSFRACDHRKHICQRSPTTAPLRKVVCLVQIASMEQELHVSPDPPIPTDPYLFL